MAIVSTGNKNSKKGRKKKKRVAFHLAGPVLSESYTSELFSGFKAQHVTHSSHPLIRAATETAPALLAAITNTFSAVRPRREHQTIELSSASVISYCIRVCVRACVCVMTRRKGGWWKMGGNTACPTVDADRDVTLRTDRARACIRGFVILGWSDSTGARSRTKS